ncbi:DNA-packaging protein [Bacillus methanolicus]|uniref:head-tail connector protein n=1 Tax=Bacillus methanolicus TaxID=1471 RepID=UPI0023802795|nr:head-tail connector protein [Bacillus methanolicus]MDE3838656.1 DNA-packaging protein [Bacillus methanolicus]
MLEEVKQYLRIDGSEEDSFLTSLILAAKEYIKNTTGIRVDETNDLHKLAVNLMVAHSYENRLPIGQGDTLAFSLESILLQMRYCYESGTV